MASRLTERDLEMLHSLSIARFLPTTALEWLHFPTWRTRWQQYHAVAGQRQARTCYKPSTRLYRRLQVLHKAGLIQRITRPVSLALTTFSREPNLYALNWRGAAVLAAARDIDQRTLWYEAVRERSFLTLMHSSLIGIFYAALRAKVETMCGVRLEHWRGDHLLARAYDRIPVKAPAAGGATRTTMAPVLPDGTCVIRYPGGSVRCFVEIDRGRPIATWREKIRAYEAYAGSTALRERYGVDSFLLLTATIRENQRRRLLEATAEITGGASDRYLFCLIDDVHPHTIGSSWTRITAVQPQTTSLLGRAVTTYAVETAQHTLLKGE